MKGLHTLLGSIVMFGLSVWAVPTMPLSDELVGTRSTDSNLPSTYSGQPLIARDVLILSFY